MIAIFPSFLMFLANIGVLDISVHSPHLPVLASNQHIDRVIQPTILWLIFAVIGLILYNDIKIVRMFVENGQLRVVDEAEDTYIITENGKYVANTLKTNLFFLSSCRL